MASSAVDFALDSLSTTDANLLLGLEDEIMLIKTKLEFLRLFLADADQKRRDRHSNVGEWVTRLREVAYDLEDVLERYTVKLDLQRMGLSGWKTSPWLRCCISPISQLLTRREFASQMRKITATLDEIASNKSLFPDPINVTSSSQDSIRINTLRTEVEEEPTGQNTNVEELIPKILCSNAQRWVIIPIFGMGGSGKTTLAKRLYEDREVRSHFDLCAWLTISQTFTFVDVLRSLMRQLKVEGDTSNEDEMKQNLKYHLSKKSFIIVLDDIWDISAWAYLKTIFPREHEGIAVLLTTRSQNIAAAVDPNAQPFQLQPLEPEESWQLFCKEAFADANYPENFQLFKKVVIKRTQGLPLAIVVLGRLLRKTKDPNQWKDILDNPRWEEEDKIARLLFLSYDCLPRHLKACFLYVAGYPEDHNIKAEELMRRWMAEGFIQRQQWQTIEDSAEEYLEELMQRSLILLVKRNDFGKVDIVQVHDLVHDMARKESQEINFLHHNISHRNLVVTRRLSLCDDGIHNHFNRLHNYRLPMLRSLHIQSTGSRNIIPSTFINFRSTKFLRVLSLQGIQFQNGKCPEAIGSIIRLRYLCFKDSNLKELPYNISNLIMLQTLDVRGTNVTQLQEVSKLTELQTLEGGKVNHEWIIKDGLHMLKNIRTLSMHGVIQNLTDTGYKELEKKLIDAIEKLKDLALLQLNGELASMKVLTTSNTSLQCLKLEWRRGYCKYEQNPVLQTLPNLHTLVLVNMHMTQDDMDVIGLLPRLESLTIEDELQKLVFKEGYFSSLKELQLRTCWELESWEVIGSWSKSSVMLQLLQIGWCPKLKLLPEGLKVEEIQLWYQQLTDELKLWAKQTLEVLTQA